MALSESPNGELTIARRKHEQPKARQRIRRKPFMLAGRIVNSPVRLSLKAIKAMRAQFCDRKSPLNWPLGRRLYD